MTPRIPYDRTLIAIVLTLLGFGLIMVFSASGPISKELYGSHTAIFIRQLTAVILGLLLLLITMRIDYLFYQRRSVVYSLLILTLVLLVFVLWMPGGNGVRRWIRFGTINFQPSELAKLVVIIFSSFYLIRKKELLKSFSRGLVPYLLVVGTIVVLVAVEPDLGTAVSITMTSAFLLFVGGIHLRFLLALSAAALPVLFFMVLSAPYRFNRIIAFLDPEKDPYGISYQVRQSLIAIGSGGWKGLGFAQGKQKLFFLPEPHTDFVFSVVGEELGFLGCLALLLLFGLLFWKSVKIALRAKTPFGTFLGLGIAATIILQALINISVSLSMMPAKGLPLPLISVGGSSMVIMLAALGILLNISRDTDPHKRSKGWIKVTDA